MASRKKIIIVSDDLKIKYPHNLNMYWEAPDQTIPLFEFEDLALDRLRVLKIIEFANSKCLTPYSVQWKQFIIDELNTKNLTNYVCLIKSTGCLNPTDQDLQARKCDHFSHFILRFSYCRSDELRRWFLNSEVELFKLKLHEMSWESILQFFEVNDFNYNPISNEEKMLLREELTNSTSGSFEFETTAFYKIPFKHVISLVKTRSVFIKKGFAYVPTFEMKTFVASNFKSHLSEALNYACKRMYTITDERVKLLFNNFNSGCTGKVYTQTSSTCGVVSASKLDVYSKQHYPLCMRSIHQQLMEDHHLKHFARVQYLFFLRGIGLSYEECMLFWKDEFCKKIDSKKFEKDYAYSVKHAFGKVGNKTVTSLYGYSCERLIKDNVGPGQTNGCPYKHWDKNVLKQKLENVGIISSDVAGIVKLASDGHYQMACAKYFEYTHGKPNQNDIDHPNQYFEDSFNFLRDDKTIGANTKQVIPESVTKMEH